MLTECVPIHSISGRVRVRIPVLAALSGRSRGLAERLAKEPGIRAVQMKPACHSVAITYNESCLDSKTVAGLVAKHLEDSPMDASSSAQPAAEDGQSSSWLPWGMSTAAIAAGLLGSPGLVLLTLGSSLPVLRRAIRSMFQNRRLNVDVLDAAALSVLVGRGQFLTGAAMVWLINLGDVIRDVTLAKSQRAIESLFEGKCPTAWVVRKGKRRRIPVAKIRRGDILIVYPGETIPADGAVMVGTATVDQSFLTGESMPVVKEPGAPVFAGTVSRDGKLYIRAEKIGQDSMISKVAQLVKQAPVRDTRVLTLAAAAERRFNHPMATAIEQAASDAGLRVPEREDSNYTIGLGVEAVVRGVRVRVGSRRYMDSKGVPVTVANGDALAIENQAATPIYVALEDEIIGLLVLSDPLREDAVSAIQALRDGGIQNVMMLTGDRPAVADQVARTLGIDRYMAEVFPEEKLAFVQSLQQEGHTVAVVGDGVNDSPALAQADVGIAMPNGTDIAVESAHVVLLEGGLWKIPRAVDIAHAAMKIIDQGWRINFYSNTATIVAAMVGLIGPITATVVSNGSAVAATLNSLRPLLGNGHPRDTNVPQKALPSPTTDERTQLTAMRSSIL